MKLRRRGWLHDLITAAAVGWVLLVLWQGCAYLSEGRLKWAALWFSVNVLAACSGYLISR